MIENKFRNSTRQKVAEKLYHNYLQMFRSSQTDLIDLISDDRELLDLITKFDQPESQEEFCRSIMSFTDQQLAKLEKTLTGCDENDAFANRFVNRFIATSKNDCCKK